MPNNLTDAEVKKAFMICNNLGEDNYCSQCPYEYCDRCVRAVARDTLDLINRQEEEKKNLEVELKAMRNAANGFKAEVERLQNAYKQCAWERDIFAEDMKEEIKKDCSYLMLDIKTIKAEAYKEAFEKLKEKKRTMLDYDEAGFSSKITVVSIEEIDNLSNELVGDGDE